MAPDANESSRTTLRVGAAAVDISPEMGVQIDGSIGIRRPAELILDPIYAHALVLEAAGRKVCFLSLDLLSITKPCADRIRGEAAQMLGITPEAVICHVTQNHAAPSLGHLMCDEENPYYTGKWWWMRGGDERYTEPGTAGTLEAVRQADAALRPALLGVDRGMDDRVAFNRRYVLRDGRAEMGHGGDVRNVLHREGLMDPEVGVACFQTPDLSPVALLLHHTCHPVHGYPRRFITAGWPGAWCSEMARVVGAGCVPMVANGCCGNVIHHDILNPTQEDTYERSGRLLAETATRVLRGIRYNGEIGLDARSRTIKIPYREIPAERLAQARRMLEDTPEPPMSKTQPGFIDWDWIYAVMVLDVERLKARTGLFDYEIQAFRIGDLALVALLGEPFVEGQLRIKMKSPFAHTFIAHMSNAYVGYVPTPEAIARGGFETRLGWGSKLAPEALDMIVEETTSLLREMAE